MESLDLRKCSFTMVGILLCYVLCGSKEVNVLFFFLSFISLFFIDNIIFLMNDILNGNNRSVPPCLLTSRFIDADARNIWSHCWLFPTVEIQMIWFDLITNTELSAGYWLMITSHLTERVPSSPMTQVTRPRQTMATIWAARRDIFRAGTELIVWPHQTPGTRPGREWGVTGSGDRATGPQAATITLTDALTVTF